MAGIDPYTRAEDAEKRIAEIAESGPHGSIKSTVEGRDLAVLVARALQTTTSFTWTSFRHGAATLIDELDRVGLKVVQK